MTHYAILITGWILYFFVHSLLASDRVKKIVIGTIVPASGYRIIYSTISTIGLLYLMYLNAMDAGKLFQPNGVVRYLSLMSATFGVTIILQAFKQYSIKSFLGFEAENNRELKTQGILNIIRHPLYTGTILIVVGYLLFSPTRSTLVSAACIFLYLPIGIYLEERKLIANFGEQYISYKRKVPALFPNFKKRN